MKRIFISYRFTGEKRLELEKTLKKLHDAIESAGHNTYSTIFESDQFANEKFSGKTIMEKAFKEIDNSDIIMFFVKGNEISNGMLLELGYCLAKKRKMILAIKKDLADSVFRRHIDDVIEFDTIDDLCEKLSKLK